MSHPFIRYTLALIFALLASAACSAGPAAESADLSLPTVTAMTADGRPLRVVATTSLIGDVVGRVGGEAIDLTVLMQPGQDPHSYQPGAADLTAAADADLIFINGWNLEEGLIDDLTAIGRDAAIVPISAGVEPLAVGQSHAHPDEDDHDEDDHDDHAEDDHAEVLGNADPHVWLDVANVIQWTENARRVLAAADPTNAAAFDANAAAYRAELEQLDAELRDALRAIPDEARRLVANHDSLAYFAAAYDFHITGAIIPSVSTLAEPSAGALAELVERMTTEGVCALILETTTSDQLARTLQQELTNCDEVRLITLYTGALGPAGSGADTYVGMMRANVAALIEALGD